MVASLFLILKVYYYKYHVSVANCFKKCHICSRNLTKLTENSKKLNIL